jgi:RNA polymerase sigma-70 factor (ECF subfamily)
MATGQDNSLLRHLRRAALLQDAGDVTDGQLLERFLAMREEAAFEVLVRRHGPMVLGVCRRVLSNVHDAEDAFQVTFLVLIRKGPSLLPRNTLGNWLYGVAYHTALKARAASWKRHAKERQAAVMSRPQAPAEDMGHDLLPLLDRELDCLPDKYREAVVLCELEGKTREEAARQLGVPTGTLSGRLTTARRMLARRLTRRGVVMPGTALATVLAPGVASACVPPALVGSTVKAASALAAGQTAAGALSAEVAALTRGMLKSMLLAKLKLTTAALLIAAALGGSAGGFAYHLSARASAPPEVGGSNQRPNVPEGESRNAEVPPEPQEAAPDDKTQAKQSDKEKLQGAWVPAKAVVNGRPTNPNDKKIRRSALTFDDDEVALWDAKGSYRLDPDREPKQLDIVLLVKGRKELIRAIYDFYDDQLLVSWVDGRERPSDLATGKREGVFIVYVRKEKAKP